MPLLFASSKALLNTKISRVKIGLVWSTHAYTTFPVRAKNSITVFMTASTP